MMLMHKRCQENSTMLTTYHTIISDEPCEALHEFRSRYIASWTA